MAFEFDNPDSTRCKAFILTGFHGHQCSRKPWKDEWCKQHHPETIKKRDEDAQRRYDEKQARSPHVLLAKARDEITRLNLVLDARKDKWVLRAVITNAFAKVAKLQPAQHKNVLGDKEKFIDACVEALSEKEMPTTISGGRE